MNPIFPFQFPNLNEFDWIFNGFPFYRRLYLLFDWIFNEFAPLLISRSIFARGGVLPARRAPAPRAKMLRLISKRPNPLNIQSIQGIQSLVKEKSFEYSIKRLISSFWKRGKGIWYIYLLIDLIIRLVYFLYLSRKSNFA